MDMLPSKLSTAQSSTERLPDTGEQVRLTTGQDEDEKALVPADSSYWKPFFLSGSATLSLAVTFLAIIIGLAVLYSQSRAHSGIATTDGSLHYLWTFEPIALFTVILVFWGLLEYQAKLLAPWHAMARSAAPADKSVFLDYISPWNVLVLPKAIADKQPVAFLAITGSLLIRLLIVLSTGLLVSETVSITRAGVPLPITQKLSDVPGPFHPGRVDGRASRIVTAVKEWNVSYPPGSENSYALPTIDISQSSLPSDAIVTFDTEVFTADLECEIASSDFTFSTTNINKDGYPVKDTTVDVPGTGASYTCSAPDEYSIALGCPFLNVSFAGAIFQPHFSSIFS